LKLDLRWLLLAPLALARIAADALDLDRAGGLAAATCASPAPRVFCAVRGLETFSTRFFLEGTGRDGVARSREIDAALYARLSGPYNRRNVYGAALAYGPALAADPRTEPMLRAVLDHAFAPPSPLLRELGLDPDEFATGLRLRYEPREGTVLEGLPTVLEIR
jgi:hypothetical protein